MAVARLYTASRQYGVTPDRHYAAPVTRRQRKSRNEGVHPTYERILEQAVVVLQEDGFDRFSVQRVLDDAGVSRATLYNYFSDVDTLIEAALVETFARESAILLERFDELTAQATDRAEFVAALQTYLTMFGQLPIGMRMRRAHTISLSTTRPALAAAIAKVQDEITAGWQVSIEKLQQRDVLRADLDARTVAVMVQGTAIGRIVDDAAGEQVGPDRWMATFLRVVERSFVTPED